MIFARRGRSWHHYDVAYLLHQNERRIYSTVDQTNKWLARSGLASRDAPLPRTNERGIGRPTNQGDYYTLTWSVRAGVPHIPATRLGRLGRGPLGSGMILLQFFCFFLLTMFYFSKSNIFSKIFFEIFFKIWIF
jgi:hypothetical protein